MLAAQAAVAHRREWRLNMNIFQNLNHRGLIYNGSKPMRSLQAPEEGSGDLYGFYGQGGYGSQHSQDFDRNVKHVRNADDVHGQKM